MATSRDLSPRPKQEECAPWANRTYEQLVNSPKRELKIFTEREGGVQHSIFDNGINAGQYIADWGAEVLGGRVA